MVHSTCRAPPIFTPASHAQVVVAVHRPDRLVGVGHALAQGPDELTIQFGNGIADGVGDVDGGRALFDHRLQDTAEEVHVAAVAVFRAELDVIDQIARETHRLDRLLQHLLARHAQLLLHVELAGGNEGVDAGAVRALERLGGARDVAVVGARQRAHGGVFDGVGDCLHTIKISVGAGGKTGFDHIDFQALKLARYAQLLVFGHGCARRLLAIAQGGVKNDELVGHVILR
jgi:hypothetical protein